jgi:hypothetical protein
MIYLKDEAITKKQSEKIFIQELITLKERGYIKPEAFRDALAAYNAYKHDEEKLAASAGTDASENRSNLGKLYGNEYGSNENRTGIDEFGSSENRTGLDEYGFNENLLNSNEYRINENNLAGSQFDDAGEKTAGTVAAKNQTTPAKRTLAGVFSNSTPKHVPVQKKELTTDQIREKNLNIILTLGTVFIFLAGLIFGTSSWSVIGDEVKTLLLLVVGTIFFGVSYVCKNVLKIEKTSFTFWALGTMFLPLCLMSIGYFGLLGQYFSLKGQGKFIFCAISSLICIPIFYISFTKYSKQLYLYVMVLAMDFFIVCLINSFSLSTYIYIAIITLLNGLVLFAHVKRDLLHALNIPSLMKFNVVASFILLGFHFNNSYGFYVDVIILAITIMCISILDKEVTSFRSISSGILYSVGFCGATVKIVQDIFTEEYTLMVPLLLFFSLIAIYSFIKDMFKVEDKYFYHFTMAEGILSFLLLCALTPFFHQYQIISITGVIVNFLGLIWCYKIHGCLMHKSILSILSLLFVGSITVLSYMNFEKEYKGLAFLLVLSFLILIWILVKAVKFIDIVYKPILLSLNIWLVFSIYCNMIYNYEYTFLSFLCLTLFSIYCCKNDFLKKLHKYAIAAEYYLLILTSLVFVNSRVPSLIFEQYMLVVFIILFVTHLIIVKKFKNLGSIFNYLIFINWALSLLPVALKLFEPFLRSMITDQVKGYLLIFILLNVCYFLYYYNKEKHAFLPTLAGLSFYPLIYLVLMNNSLVYETMFLIPVILLFALYFIYKNKVCLYNLYAFAAVCFLVGINGGLVFRCICFVMVTALYALSYRLDEFIATTVIGIYAGILSFVIPVAHIQDRTIHAFAVMCVAILLRIVGVKLYKMLFVNEKIDILSLISTILLILTLGLFPDGGNRCYFQFLTYFVLAGSIYLESFRNKNLSKYLIILSQLVLSIGYYTVAISLNPSSILVFKIYLIPVIAMYIMLKLIWKDQLDKNIYNLLNFVVCFWLLADAAVVDTVTNNILIGIILLVAMLAAMAMNNKQIVNASIITLLAVLIVGYRRFLLSLPWWVYLLAIGSALIGVAIYLEKKRNRNKE